MNQLSEEETSKVKSITNGREVFLDGVFKSSDLDLISTLGVTGIILKGGDEEKVGYKSFEELDEVLEALFD